MRHGRRMLDQCTCLTKADSQCTKLQGIEEHRYIGRIKKSECDHAARSAHLLPGEFILRMFLESRINDIFDFIMTLQELCHSHCILVMPVHTDWKCLHSPDDKPGRERCNRAAHVLCRMSCCFNIIG